MPRVRTEAQKAATKRKRAERPEATKKASQKWKAENPDEVKKGSYTRNRRVSLRTWRIALLALLMMCPLQRSDDRQVVAQETGCRFSFGQLRKSRHKTEEFMAWLQDKDDHDAEELTRILNLPIDQRKKAYNELTRKSDVPSCTAPMWRDVSQLFSETTMRDMFQQIFELMLKENGENCDDELIEQFNLFSRRVAPTMIELLISALHWVPYI